MSFTEDSTAALLIVLGEPLEDSHPELILGRVEEGLNSWSAEKSGIDFSTELRNFLNKNIQPEAKESSGLTVKWSSKDLHVEVVFNPGKHFLVSRLRSFLHGSSRYKHIVHAGPVFAGNGSWIVADGTLSFYDLAKLFKSGDVQTALETHSGSTVAFSCFGEGDWSDSGVRQYELNKHASVIINPTKPDGKSDLDGVSDVLSYLGIQFITQTPVEELLKGADIVGNLRFNRPTAYIFPGGDGDSALFAVDGFYLLLDGGFQRKPPCWDFVRHLDRIDSFLITRLGNANVLGVSSFLKRKAVGSTYPKVGHVFGNFPLGLGMGEATAPVRKESNPLIINIFALGTEMRSHLFDIGLKPQPCLSLEGKTIEPVILYQKLGYGCLEMFVLNPTKDSKELKDFFHHWEQSVAHGAKSGGHQLVPGVPAVPLSNLVSIAVLIVWRPADPDDSITRVLYPGGCPQEKLFAALEKLKHLRYLQFSNCSEATLFTPKTAGASGVGAKPTPRLPPSKPSPPTPTHKSTAPISHSTPVPPSAAIGQRRASPVGQAKSPSPTATAPTASSRPTTLPSSAAAQIDAAATEIHDEMTRKASTSEKQRVAKTPPSSPSEEKPLPKAESPAQSPPVENVGVAPVEPSASPAEIEETTGEKVETPSSIPSPAADLKNQILAGVQHHVDNSESPKIVQTPEEILSFKPISPGSPLSPDSAAAKMGEILAGRTPISPQPPAQFPGPAEFKPVESPSPKLSPRSPVRSPIDPKLSPLSPFAPEFVPRNVQRSPLTVSKESPSVSPRDVQPDLVKEMAEGGPTSPSEEDLLGATGYDNRAFRDKDDITSPTDDSFQLPGAHSGHEGGPASLFAPEKLDEVSALMGNLSISSTGKAESLEEFSRDPLMFTGQSSIAPTLAYTPSPDDGSHRQMGDGMSPREGEGQLGSSAAAEVVLESPIASPVSPNPIGGTTEFLNAMVNPTQPRMDPFSSGAAWEMCGPAVSSPSESSVTSPDVQQGDKTAATRVDPFGGAAAWEMSSPSVASPTSPQRQSHGIDIDELNQLWGKPLGLPAPPGTSKPSGPAAKPTAKPTTNGNAKPPAKPTTSARPVGTSRPAAPAKPAVNNTSAAGPAARPPTTVTAKKPAGPPPTAKPSAAGKAPLNTTATGKNISATAKPTAESAKAAAKPPAKAAPKTTGAAVTPAKKLLVPTTPFYFDLVYLPHNGNPHYIGVDFFKSVRAKHYVLSGLYPDKEVLDALLAGKKSWNTADEVTLIPTVDSETLNLWMSLHKDELVDQAIDVAPSATRCTLNLQDQETCAAYKLEF